MFIRGVSVVLPFPSPKEGGANENALMMFNDV